MSSSTRADFKVPMLLLALSFVPVLGGVARFYSLLGGESVSADDARFFGAPAPVVIHIGAATLYAVLGAFQFSAGIRSRWRRWHRRAGVLLVVCALLAGASGIWMTMAYAIPSSLQGPLLYAVRLLVGVAMLASIVKAWRSAARRELAQHEAWMIRAYALAQGAGTQALMMLPVALIWGPVLGLVRDLVMTAAWLLNWGVAEWLIRRGRRSSRPQPAALALG